MKPEEELGKLLTENNYTISTAESCTGGLVSSKITDIAGSSNYVKLNLVTYSNDAKHKMLGVSEKILNDYGAVSSECAQEMAEGLFKLTGADITLCTTGIAGPGGATADKPVGLMYTAVKFKDIITVKKVLLKSQKNRIRVKEEFANEAIKLAVSILSENRIG